MYFCQNVRGVGLQYNIPAERKQKKKNTPYGLVDKDFKFTLRLQMDTEYQTEEKIRKFERECIKIKIEIMATAENAIIAKGENAVSGKSPPKVRVCLQGVDNFRLDLDVPLDWSVYHLKQKLYDENKFPSPPNKQTITFKGAEINNTKTFKSLYKLVTKRSAQSVVRELEKQSIFRQPSNDESQPNDDDANNNDISIELFIRTTDASHL
ncbi:hypothetical protein RFI_27718, partial [Reticulomyxa filosa]